MLRTCCVLLAVLLTSAALADTINVPADHATIQAAIDAAQSGDEVVIQPGTYTEQIDFLGKAITVRGATGDPMDVIIDGNRLGSVVTCASGEGSDSILEAVTLTGGVGTGDLVGASGGGMYNEDSSPTVQSCRFIDNVLLGGFEFSEGGGMYNDNAPATVIGCFFSGNRADGGGAIYSSGSPPLIMDCHFSGNDAGGPATCGASGGAIFGDAIVMSCTFENNEADSGSCAGGASATGGAVASVSTVIDCTFIDNNAGANIARGGAISGTSLVVGCTFTNNRVSGGTGVIGSVGGGAIRCSGATIIKCTFFDNTATGHDMPPTGGAVHANDSTFINCLFVDNDAVGLSPTGGGIAMTDCEIINCTFGGNSHAVVGSGTVANCILWGNDIEIHESIMIEGTPTVTYSNVAGGAPGVGNIDADPLFADAELRLGAGSPCVDAGSNDLALCYSDLDDNERFADDPGVPDTGQGTAPIVDLGAYERGSTAARPSCTGVLPEDVCNDCNANGVPDACDLELLTSADCNENGVPDDCEPLPPCASDADDSGVVDVDDLVAVILDWDTSGALNCGDVNGSGNVDVDDLVQVILSFGPC